MPLPIAQFVAILQLVYFAILILSLMVQEHASSVLVAMVQCKVLNNVMMVILLVVMVVVQHV